MSSWCLHFLPENERKQVDKWLKLISKDMDSPSMFILDYQWFINLQPHTYCYPTKNAMTVDTLCTYWCIVPLRLMVDH